MKTQWVAIGVLVLLCGCQQQHQQPAAPGAGQTVINSNNASAATKAEEVKYAVAVLQPIADSKVSGTIEFTDRGDHIEVSGTVEGLTPGKHAFHVHQYGDLTDLKKGEAAGGHFNPEEKPHGAPEDSQRHVGDLGNITAEANGTATIKISDRVIKLNGPHSIVGRCIVVHSKADQFTQPVGDAGPRVAEGVIGIAKQPATAAASADKQSR